MWFQVLKASVRGQDEEEARKKPNRFLIGSEANIYGFLYDQLHAAKGGGGGESV